MLVAPLLAVLIAATWFVPMALRHGLDTLVAGAGSRELDLADSAITLIAEMINPPNLAFTVGAVGLVIVTHIPPPAESCSVG